ncbi:MAG: hypothetical protein BA863_17700 [Desulfovibrio sp. S3730MH75]|nr:MAG: hypothetical protein BA863_17700 [Desulfovibrio sp. S3730MH75]
MRSSIRSSGSFVSVPPSERVDKGLRDAFKMEFKTVLSREQATGPIELETEFSTEWALLDIGAISPSSISPESIAKDCELVKNIVLKHPDQVRRLVEAFQPDRRKKLIDLGRAYGIAEGIGLTEEQSRSEGGGLLGLAVLVVAALLASGCQSCGSGHVKPDPKPHQTSDGGDE